MSQIRHAQPQITAHPIMVTGKETLVLEWSILPEQFRTLGRHVSESPAQPSIYFCRPQDSSH